MRPTRLYLPAYGRWAGHTSIYSRACEQARPAPPKAPAPIPIGESHEYNNRCTPIRAALKLSIGVYFFLDFPTPRVLEYNHVY